ncbi:MAG TPA: FkbM family methyltransferase [Verrucomicrobiae bacterium]|nr:FkbM family methyltransferase [Verrucomicrobiae bacterium]
MEQQTSGGFFKRWAKTLKPKEELRCDQDNSFPADPFEAQRRLLGHLDRTDFSILDVGGNKGQTTKKYRSLFPRAEIYCFEAFPDCIDELQKQFHEDPKIHVVPKAVAASNGVATFHVNEFDATNSLLPRTVSGRRYYSKTAGPKGTIEVEMTALDEFLRSNNVQNVQLLKLDIQGGELNALRGAESLLRAGNVSLIFTEIWFVPHYEGAPLFHEIWSFLSKFDYSLFDVYDLHRATNGQLRYGDALFVSKSLREKVINNYSEEP